jgi:hypothetical protein
MVKRCQQRDQLLSSVTAGATVFTDHCAVTSRTTRLYSTKNTPAQYRIPGSLAGYWAGMSPVFRATGLLSYRLMTQPGVIKITDHQQDSASDRHAAPLQEQVLPAHHHHVTQSSHSINARYYLLCVHTVQHPVEQVKRMQAAAAYIHGGPLHTSR